MPDAPETNQKTASGALVYLVEELGDARLRAQQLKQYLHEATKLIEQSSHKDHFFEVAGHLIHGVPEAAFKLEKALDAVALAANHLDNEELKNSLKPEKADELERVLKDVRYRVPVHRSEESEMNPKIAIEKLREIAATARENGALPVFDVVDLFTTLENGFKQASEDDAVADRLDALASDIEAAEDQPSRLGLANQLRAILAEHGDASDFLALKDKVGAAHPLEKQREIVIRKLAKVLAQEVNYGVISPKEDRAILQAASKALGVRYASVEATDKKEGDDDEKESRHEEGKSVDPTKDMSPEDAKAWKTNTEKHKDKFKKDADDDDEKQSRHEKGKSVDPTKDMSPEDAAKWKSENEKNRDKFKTADWKLAKLMSRQQKVLKKYLDSAGARAASDFDSLPSKVQGELRRVKDQETLASDVDRWLMDNNNPHLRSASESWKAEGPQDPKAGKSGVTASDKEAAGVNVGRLQRAVDNVDKQLKELKHSLTLYKKDPGKNKPQLDNFIAAINSLNSTNRLALRALGEKVASDAWKVEAADVTKREWVKALKADEAMLKKYEDSLRTLERGGAVENLTVQGAKGSIAGLKAVIQNKKELIAKLASGEITAAYHIQPKKLFKVMPEAVKGLINGRADMRRVQEMLADILSDATGVVWTDNYQNPAIKKVRDSLYELDHAMGEAFRDIERLEKDMKPMVVGGRTASDAWKVEAAKVKFDERTVMELEAARLSLQKVLSGSNPRRMMFTAVQSIGMALDLMGMDGPAKATYRAATEINKSWTVQDMLDYKKAAEPSISKRADEAVIFRALRGAYAEGLKIDPGTNPRAVADAQEELRRATRLALKSVQNFAAARSAPLGAPAGPVSETLMELAFWLGASHVGGR